MGPLHGLRIVEMSNIGPAPFCGMLLADLGAEVLRVDRLATSDLGLDVPLHYDLLNRNKQAIAIDLKNPDGVATVLALTESADMLIEGFRPGVMERLGLGPDICLQKNPKLIYGRLTGWGQSGPMSQLAGHDINYIALAGALAAIGPVERGPSIPLNLVGDFAGGSLYLAMGLLAALHDRTLSGKGQVIDAAMVDGVAHLMTMHMGFRQAGIWENRRESNAVDGGAPYYTTYLTRDGKYMAVGAVEQRFYRLLVERLELTGPDLPEQNDRSRWGELRARFAAVFLTKDRDEWSRIFAGSDACVSPVLDMDESIHHPHAQARGIYQSTHSFVEPNPAPRFSRTLTKLRHGPVDPATNTHRTLSSWGISQDHIQRLQKAGAIPGAAAA